MRESAVERYFCKLIEKEKGKAYKWVSPGNKGVPDRLVFLHGVTFLVELKAPDGRLSAIQKAQHKKLKDLGFDPIVIDTKEKAKLWVGLQSSVLKRVSMTYEDLVREMCQ